MARKQSGGINKFLNFIGLIDDVEPQGAYDSAYSSDAYGRPSTYVPKRPNNARAPQRPVATARRSIPAQTSRSGRGVSRAYGDADYRDPRRDVSARYDVSGRYDDYGAPQMSAPRTRSRFEESPPQRAPESSFPSQRATARISARQRTVMFSLHSLEDCCEVIDNLINGVTIVLTIDELDGRLMQRAVDTLSGAVFALHAIIRKASDKTYLIAPNGVEVNETYDMDQRF